MPTDHGKQKKALKQKKKREAAQLKARETSRLSLHPARSEVLRAASGRPLGPAYVSDDWEITDTGLPRLVSVIVSRIMPGQLVLAGLALVDRTCLGVKNAMLFPLQTELELEQRVARMADAVGSLRRVEPLVAQSIVYNAVDFARSLGFAPHGDFPDAIFGPRPAVLLDTALAHPARPNYVSGPDDNIARVIAQLERAVGAGGFDVMAAFSGSAPFLLEELDLDEDDEEEDDDSAGAAEG